MSESWVRVGAKCVAVDSYVPDERGGDALVKGEIYTINGIVGPDMCGSLGVSVAEAKSWHSMGGGWNIRHFRPLVTHEQDIALFTEIAKTSGLDIELEQLEAAWRESERTQ